MSNLGRVGGFVQDMPRAVERHGADEPRMLDEGERLLRDLVGHDAWLPEADAAPSTESYRPYPSHAPCSPACRWSASRSSRSCGCPATARRSTTTRSGASSA